MVVACFSSQTKFLIGFTKEIKMTTTKQEYVKLKNHTGLYLHLTTKRYQARIKIKGKLKKASFKTLRQALDWKRAHTNIPSLEDEATSSTLQTVWEVMQDKHFPSLAPSTVQIWYRRYELLKQLEHLEMHKITSAKIMSWVEKNVKHFKSSKYEGEARGRAKRCNLDNELNLFTTIFNWYKNDSEIFEEEAAQLTNPVRTKHKKKGFIRVKPLKERAITLDDALKFFSYLKPLYRDLALFQYFTASRIGEAAGLQWHRIDFDRRKIIIMETCGWDMTSKMFTQLNPHPKSKEPRQVYMTNELREILERMKCHQIPGNNFVFHVEGAPLNYGTIQLNYREAQRKGKLPYSGTHILRHGMATLARKVGGGLDAVIAMTGHKDFKLADHYSKLNDEYQQEVSEKIMDFISNVSSRATEAGVPKQIIDEAKGRETTSSIANVLMFKLGQKCKVH